jgi:hypothetical protein
VVGSLLEGKSFSESFYEGFKDYGEISFNLIDIGTLADFFGSTQNRRNEDNQHFLDQFREKKSGFVLSYSADNGLSYGFDSIGIDVGGALYDFGRHGFDYFRLKEYRNGKDEVSRAIWNSYVTGDYAAENEAMRLVRGLDTFEIQEEGLTDSRGAAVNGIITSNGLGGRSIVAVSQANILNSTLILQYMAHRDGVAGEDNGKETLRLVTANTEMAIRMLANKSQTMESYSQRLQDDIARYREAKEADNMDLFNSYIDSTYDSSADYYYW